MLSLLDRFFKKTVGIISHYIPEYKTPGSAGFDIELSVDYEILPGQLRNCRTGIKLEIPRGYSLFLISRSSLGQKKLIIPNSVGVIDSDYRGEIIVPLLNLSDESVYLRGGTRVAQGVLVKVYSCSFRKLQNLSETLRNCGGFGSTGLF